MSTPDYTQQMIMLNEHIHTSIPITQAMSINVSDYDGASLTLQAPLAANINDKQTAFAGSLSAIASLSGWCLIHMKLSELAIKADIAIYQADIHYLKPATSTFSARTALAPAQQFNQFIARLNSSGKAKLPLQTQVRDEEKNVVELSSKYVAFTK